MGKQLFANNAVGVLASGITNVATTLTLSAGQGTLFPTISGGDWFMVTLYQMSGGNEVNHEVIKVTTHAAASDTFGVIVRGQEGTTARAFNAADPIQMRATKGTFEQLLQRAADAFTGLVKFFTGASIAAAATVDLTGATGNTLHLTGNTGVTGVTMTAGQVMDLIIDGTPLFTHHATNLNLPGAANIQGAAGDRMRLFYDGTTVYVLDYIRANGGIIRGLGVGQTFTDVAASRTAGVQYTNSTDYPIWVTISAYSNVNSAVYLSVNGSSNQQVRNDGVLAGVPEIFQAVVKPGDTYILTNSAGTLTISKWWELR